MIFIILLGYKVAVAIQLFTSLTYYNLSYSGLPFYLPPSTSSLSFLPIFLPLLLFFLPSYLPSSPSFLFLSSTLPPFDHSYALNIIISLSYISLLISSLSFSFDISFLPPPSLYLPPSFSSSLPPFLPPCHSSLNHPLYPMSTPIKD